MKKSKIILLILVPFFCLYLTAVSYGHDTDIYAAKGQGVEPNILIIFDNSLSMGSLDGAIIPCSPIPTKIYEKKTSGSSYYWKEYAQKMSDLPACVQAGFVSGYFNNKYTTSNCTRTRKTLATGAYLNGNGEIPMCYKLDVAKNVINGLLTDIQNVRVGLMVFNSTNEGGHIVDVIDSIDNNRAELISDVTAIQAETYTPLAETLYEAGLYFKGEHYFDPIAHDSPIQFTCQKNYVILMTDGKSTADSNNILKTIGNNGDYDRKGEDPYGPPPCSSYDSCYDLQGSDYLNDVAKYLYDTQKISTYTIGFNIDYDLLKRAAEQGNGHYYTANDTQQLTDAFYSAIDEILSKSTSFVAPIVPVSRMERTTSGDKIYLALFKPKQYSMWSGNIKMYGVAQSTIEGEYLKGDILDKNNLKAIDSSYKFVDAAISYWNSTQDGGDVEKGGAGEVLLKRAEDRKIYTYFSASGKTDLTDSENAFTTSNNRVTLDVLALASTGVPEQDTANKNNLIEFVHGYDAYDDDTDGDTTEKRQWILGSFLHSRPFLIHYKTRSVIFAGSNDGMLHAFDDSNGEELWAFIPPDQLSRLQYLHSDLNATFVDGSSKAYVTYDSNNNVTKAILIFGERRGGNRYYALNITDPEKPIFLWDIRPDTEIDSQFPYAEMGQTWSSPVLGKIACEGEGTCVGGEKVVAFIGGGYDNDNQDFESIDPAHAAHPYTDSPDTKGRAVYILDISDGSLIQSFSNAKNSDMNYSIPGDISKLDLNGDGKVDRLYVGDMGGKLWRFDIKNVNPNNWTGKIIFKSNSDGATTNLRKIFYSPDVTLEPDDVGKGDYEMLIFGTGDREHPNDKIIVNRLYAVKDRNLRDKDPQTAYTESDLVDVTDDLLQDPDPAKAQDKIDLLFDLKLKSGWFIQLTPSDSGEKSLSPGVVFYKTAYFTTFSPSAEASGEDQCYVGEGIAKIYAVNYKLGTAVFNFDLLNDEGGIKIEKEDRSVQIGTAIPSGAIITIVNGEASAYIGVGAGVFSPKLPNRNSILPLNWRIVF